MHAVDRLRPGERAEVIGRARDALRQMRQLAPGWQAPFAIDAIGEAQFDELSDRLADLPCPLLDADGRCLGYASRPLVCRMIGLGMVTESGFVIENACPIQDQFPAYAALAPVPFPLESTEADETDSNRAAAERIFGEESMANFETTVAGAVVLLADSSRR
jgi:Fe-S-cluster containining protein